jgi:hypothetical protein
MRFRRDGPQGQQSERTQFQLLLSGILVWREWTSAVSLYSFRVGQFLVNSFQSCEDRICHVDSSPAVL